MYTYLCCRCTNCGAQVVLENRADSHSDLVFRPARPRSGREACPYCRVVFIPENYYERESVTTLLQRAS